MYIGLKDGNIIVFSQTLDELAINASVKGIILDSTEETNETIVPYYNTENDGIYFKESEVPPTPSEIVNERARNGRAERYSAESDCITNHICCLRDKILLGDYADDSEKEQISNEIADLYRQRKEIREKIVADNPYIES